MAETEKSFGKVTLEYIINLCNKCSEDKRAPQLEESLKDIEYTRRRISDILTNWCSEPGQVLLKACEECYEKKEHRGLTFEHQALIQITNLPEPV